MVMESRKQSATILRGFPRDYLSVHRFREYELPYHGQRSCGSSLKVPELSGSHHLPVDPAENLTKAVTKNKKVGASDQLVGTKP
jgi:hypothetical protein